MGNNEPYYINLIYGLALIAVGAIAGFFAARRSGQKVTIEVKNDLIKTLQQQVAQLKEEVEQLREENARLRVTVDTLVAQEQARERLRQRRKTRQMNMTP